jgi:hypothetical protein
MSVGARRIPDVLLECYLVGSLDEEARAEVEAVLAESEADRAWLEELRAESAAFLVRSPPGPLVERFEASRRRWWRKPVVLFAPVLAVAVVVALMVLVSSQDEPAGSAKRREVAKANAQEATKQQVAEANAREARRQLEAAEPNAREAQKQLRIAEANAREVNTQRSITDTNAREARRQLEAAEANAREAQKQLRIAEANAREAEKQQRADVFLRSAMLLTVSQDGTARRWDVLSDEAMAELCGSPGPVSADCFNGEVPQRGAVQTAGLEFRIHPFATLMLDGMEIGQTPLPPIEVEVGYHTVQMFNWALGKEITLIIEVKAGQPNIFNYNLISPKREPYNRRLFLELYRQREALSHLRIGLAMALGYTEMPLDAVVVKPGDELEPGSYLHAEVWVGNSYNSGYAAVLSRDASGQIKVHLSDNNNDAVSYAGSADMQETGLRGRINLGKAEGEEVVYALYSPERFKLDWAVSALREGRELVRVAPRGIAVEHIALLVRDRLVEKAALEFRIRPSATVVLDGKQLGETPLVPIEVEVGSHTVKIFNHNLGKEIIRTIEVKGGQPNVFKYNLLED